MKEVILKNNKIVIWLVVLGSCIVLPIVGVKYQIIYTESNAIKNAEFNDEYKGELKNISYKYGSKYGLADRHTHNIVVRPFADFIGGFNDYGIAFFKAKGLTGIVSNEGEILMQPTMNKINPSTSLEYEEKLISAFGYYDTKEDKWGVVSMEGKMLVPPILPYFDCFFSDEIFIYSDNKNNSFTQNEKQKLKFMNIKGEKIDFPIIYSIEKVGENYLFKNAETNLYGIANGNLKIIEEPFIKEIVKTESIGFMEIHQSQFDLQIYQDKYDMYGFLNSESLPIKKSFASEIKYWWKNRYLFRDKETKKLGIITTELDIIIDPLYKTLIENNDSDAYIYEVDNTDKKGIININGNKSDPIFQEITYFDDNDLAQFKLSENGKVGIVNTNGKIIKEPFAHMISIFDENGEASYTVSPTASKGIINVKGEIVLESQILN